MSGHTPWREIKRKRPIPLTIFLSPLRVEAIDDTHWKLLDGLIYDSEVPGVGRIIVPKGFTTDFASVPRLPLAFLLFGGRANLAATLHDWLYTRGIFPKRVADAVFYEAMRSTGIGWWTAWWMWIGVACTWGGYKAWRDHRRERNPDLFGCRLQRKWGTP